MVPAYLIQVPACGSSWLNEAPALTVPCVSQMDDGGHRENGRHKADPYKTAQAQWLMQHQPSMKHIMAIMAEKDAAIQERNLAVSEKKTALVERDMALLQRDTAIQERNTAIMERDNAIATLQYRDNAKHMQHPNQHAHHPMQISEAIPQSTVTSSDAPKSQKAKQTKEAKTMSSNRKASKPSRKGKRETDNLNTTMYGKSNEWNGGDDLNKELVVSKPDWKGQDMGLNQVAFDDSTMPAPGCSCTGVPRQCYKWGNGGWQSSCCTTTMSMHPLPAVANKRHARVGGRKMSGSAFSKLLSRLAAQGHDLSSPVDLKDHWAKHGTNRYITIK